ncbi:hypothetical protein TNCV_1281461 [Trichonephila clavipes]|nr:hypothetical protein TNCV_1281461 [Trichonephila clavipes]
MTVNDRTAYSSTLIYCYMCTNVGFPNSSTSAAPWIACKGAFIQDTPHGKPSTAVGCVCNGLMRIEPGKLIHSKLFFQMNHALICGTMRAAYALESMPVNTAFQSALSNNTQ